jgi:hypothetical protein
MNTSGINSAISICAATGMCPVLVACGDAGSSLTPSGLTVAKVKPPASPRLG